MALLTISCDACMRISVLRHASKPYGNIRSLESQDTHESKSSRALKVPAVIRLWGFITIAIQNYRGIANRVKLSYYWTGLSDRRRVC